MGQEERARMEVGGRVLDKWNTELVWDLVLRLEKRLRG